MIISIIIPNYNGLYYMKQFLPSILEQDSIENEIIIVDNGSDDGSVDWLKSLGEELILIELEKNYGFSKAINEGITKATGEYIVLLNNDIMLPQGFLSGLYSFM